MSRRKTLSEEIAELLDPTPASLILDENADDQARIVDTELGENEFDENLLEAGGSNFRIRPDISLEGGIYAGKRSSRKNLFENRQEEESEDDGEEDDDDEEEDSDAIDDHEDDDEDEDEDEEEDKNKNKTKKKKTTLSRRMSMEDEEADRFELAAMKEAEQLQKQLDQMLLDQKSVVSHLVRDEENEQEKAKHTYNQVKLWDSFLDLRIKQQKLLNIANRFPQLEYHTAHRYTNPQIKHKFDQTTSTLRSLISNLLGLQQALVVQNPELADAVVETTSTESDLWDAIAETQQRFGRFEANVIEKWSEKAQISAGKFVGNKSLKAINQGILSQVNQLMENKDRLVKRTQINRSKNRILGKRSNDEENEGRVVAKKAKSLVQEEYDEEIFDDGDFYQELLKDLIDTTQSSDPVALGKKWLELKQTQTKQRKDVDRRASKGRKIRYQVHEKLVSFMPPVPEKEAPFMVEDLFSHLFGGDKNLLLRG